MKKLLGVLCATFLVLGVVGIAGASLIKNGDFEANDGSLNYWSTMGSVQVTNLFSPFLGMDNHYALLGLCTTDGTSRLSQRFDVTGYNELTISFDWFALYWDNSASASDTFKSLVKFKDDGTVLGKESLLKLETHSICAPYFGFVKDSYTGTINLSGYALADSAKLIFKLIEESDNWCLTGTASIVGIDNVSVTGAPVPEPATMLLLGTGLVGLGLFGRKKFKK